MGLHVGIYRNTAGHPHCVFKDVEEVCVTNVDGPFEPSDKYPAAILTGNVFGSPILVPDMKWLHENGMFLHLSEGEQFAAGGDYAGASDSRFGESLCAFTGDDRFYAAIPIHDYSFTMEARR